MESSEPVAVSQNVLDRVVDLLEKIERRTDRLELIMMLRDPGSTAAADAYEGLRKQVIAGTNERMAHLNQLVQFEVALRNDPSIEDLQRLVAEWMHQAGVERIETIGESDVEILFEFLGDAGEGTVVRQPAYRDSLTQRVLRLGRVERVVASLPPPPPSPSPPPIPVVEHPSDATARTGKSLARPTAMERPMTSFGIDFGTTNSVLAVANGNDIQTVALNDPPAEWAMLGFDKVLPSVVGFEGEAAVFGWRAKRLSGSKLEAVKRLFLTEDEVLVGSKVLKVEEIAAMIFRHIQMRGADDGLTVDQAVVTIPANSRGKARARTKMGAGLAGIEVQALINEPTAAALAHARSIGDEELVMVYDFGGGTLDVTVLRATDGVFVEEASKGVQRLGGIDFDQVLASAVRAEIAGSDSWSSYQTAEFMLDIERAKVVLSDRESTNVALPTGGTIEVHRSLLEQAIRPLIEKSRMPIDQCLKDLGKRPEEIHHLVLVGGSAKVPAVRDFVSEIMKKAPVSGVDPMTAIAEGAAIAAAILNDEIDDMQFFVGTEHALGVVVNDDALGETFSVLIPRNRKLPAENTDGYCPSLDDQEIVRVRVIEGDPDLPINHEDNVILTEWEVPLLEKRKVADAGFSIQYEYDVDGILHVKAVDGLTGTTMLDTELSYSTGSDRSQLITMRKNIDGIFSQSAAADATTGSAAAPAQAGLDAASSAAIKKAKDKILPFIEGDDERRIRSLVADLEGSEGENVDTCRLALEKAIREYAYLL